MMIKGSKYSHTTETSLQNPTTFRQTRDEKNISYISAKATPKTKTTFFIQKRNQWLHNYTITKATRIQLENDEKKTLGFARKDSPLPEGHEKQ